MVNFCKLLRSLSYGELLQRFLARWNRMDLYFAKIYVLARLGTFSAIILQKEN